MVLKKKKTKSGKELIAIAFKLETVALGFFGQIYLLPAS
jgi:hypothetical protein